MATSNVGLSPFRTTFSEFITGSALESFIPGFTLLNRAASTYLNVDLTRSVAVVFLAFGLSKSLSYVWKSVTTTLKPWFTSSILIPDCEDAQEHVLNFLSGKLSNKRFKLDPGSRALIATSAKPSLFQMMSGKFDDVSSKVRFDAAPASCTWFFDGWNLILFETTDRATKARGPYEIDNCTDVKLTCIGFSAEPLKQFVARCTEQSTMKTRSQTAFYQGSSSHRTSLWGPQKLRPSRPISTIDIDQEKRDLHVSDMREYLHPSTRRFYANRGIPYRRGYLFHGPPGTGKSSISLALAGLFGLPLYILNISTTNLTGDQFVKMFEILPKSCIVLLEDIDAAGIQRDHGKRPNAPGRVKGKGRTQAVKNPKGKTVQFDDGDEAANNKGENGSHSKITLSTLLNAIDGIASNEGRILIMTTNNPETLDAALIRPGRIDLQLYFGPATSESIELCFLRMYQKDEDEVSESRETASSKASAAATTADIGKEELQNMALRFAAHVPADLFTAAEIQGYLLLKMNAPSSALRDIDAWVQTTLEERAERDTTTNHVSDKSQEYAPAKREKKVAGDILEAVARFRTVDRIPADSNASEELPINGQVRGQAKSRRNDTISTLVKTPESSNNPSNDRNPYTASNTSDGLEINTKQANTVSHRGENIVAKRERATPSSALFPTDAAGMRPLSNYFSRFYTPKGVETTPAEVRRQQQVSEYFKGVPRRGAHFFDCP